MRRRPLLAAAGTALTALTAGCSDVMSDEQQDYELSIYNVSEDSHTITVRIANSIEGYFQQERSEMGAETANEDVPVEETPSRIYLKVDSSDWMPYPWPASTYEPGSIASKAEISYRPSREYRVFVQET
ncbi:hypothetical protein BRC63_08790 [Halobacteriales archaeon QH_10_70_21]|nr:MAG: hypothetical protein BRC63_08790 [Halobacteriales archaeon QH_10_70_21]